MVDYVKLAGIAETLIADNGRDITLVKYNETPTDTDKPWRSSETSRTTGVEVTVKGVFVEDRGLRFSKLGLAFKQEEDDPIIVRGGQIFFVSANAAGANNLEEFDQLQDGSTVWQIVNVALLKPGETRLLYEIEVKQ